jgi:hypothetical protein
MTPQSIECKKCAFVNNVYIASPTAACPKCGAIYAKVDAAIQQREREAAEAKLREEKKAAHAAQVAEYERQSQRIRMLNQSVCLACGSLSDPKKVTQGSGAMETGLWIIGVVSLPMMGIGVLILIAALIYSLWRFGSKRLMKCRRCGSDEVIPADTPRGRAELQKQGIALGA